MRKLAIAFLALAAASACIVPKERYDAKVSEADELKKRADAAEAKVKEQETKLTELDAAKKAAEEKGSNLEAQLTDKESERQELQQKLQQSEALNEKLSKDTKQLQLAKAELEKKSSEYENLAENLKDEIKSGKIELSELKGRMTVKLKDKILFSSGSTKINKEGLTALEKIAKSLSKVKGKVIRVEGHTDDVPTDPKGPYPSNWELSLARAMAVVSVLQEKGVNPTQLSAAGFGQYHPIARGKSDESRSKNRRIEIVLANET